MIEEQTKDIILASKEAEESIIAMLITDNDNHKYIKNICEQDFYYLQNQKIFEIIKELYEEEENIDVISIKEKGITKKYNGQALMETLIRTTDSLPFVTNIEKTLAILKNLSMKRKIQKLAKDIYEEMIDIDIYTNEIEIKNEVIQKFKNLKTTEKTKIIEMTDVIFETMKDLDEKYKKRNDLSYRTGYLELDNIIEGLHEQEFTIIAARPGIGKTAFALQMAEHIAKKGKYTYFVSLEMSAKQLGYRTISRKANIDSHKLRMAWLEDSDFEKIVNVAGKVSEIKMCIDTESTTIQNIENRANELKIEKDLGLIIIDYLQLLKSKTKFSNREQEVADISRKLKILSKNLNIPVVALCQLNRETEKRKEPILADLRESGSLEQDADNVIFLSVDEDEEVKNRIINVNVKIAKQRNGPTGKIKIKFNKKQMKFENVEE